MIPFSYPFKIQHVVSLLESNPTESTLSDLGIRFTLRGGVGWLGLEHVWSGGRRIFHLHYSHWSRFRLLGRLDYQNWKTRVRLKDRYNLVFVDKSVHFNMGLTNVFNFFYVWEVDFYINLICKYIWNSAFICLYGNNIAVKFVQRIERNSFVCIAWCYIFTINTPKYKQQNVQHEERAAICHLLCF